MAPLELVEERPNLVDGFCGAGLDGDAVVWPHFTRPSDPQGTVNGDHGGPTLSFAADLPTAGNWRLFLQFQTGGVVHTGAVTLTAR